MAKRVFKKLMKGLDEVEAHLKKKRKVIVKKRQFRTAYDAYHFLYEHPALRLSLRNEVSEMEASELRAGGYKVERDAGGHWWRIARHVFNHALESNLSIFYAKVDKPGGKGRVSNDFSQNKYVECWLEFGTLEYGYGTDWEAGEGSPSYLMEYHDIDLDCGGPTFDEALVQLAKNVQKKYGNYGKKKKRGEDCGKPFCGDCRGSNDLMVSWLRT